MIGVQPDFLCGPADLVPSDQGLATILHAVHTEVLSKGTFSMSLLPLALSPVENVCRWKINCGGRGDDRKKIHSVFFQRPAVRLI